MTTFTLSMWVVWGLLVLVAIALYIYRERVTRDEEDELFLSEGFNAEREHQAQITASVAKIEPMIKVSRILAAVATLFVVAFYVHDFISRLF